MYTINFNINGHTTYQLHRHKNEKQAKHMNNIYDIKIYSNNYISANEKIHEEYWKVDKKQTE